MATVLMYTRPYCGFCIQSRMLLKKKGVEFEEIDLDDFPEKRAEMIERSGGRRTVPQIFIGGEAIGGCDELFALESAGKLDAMLAAGA